MRVQRSWRDVPADLMGAALAIGNFDGVHRGHQAVIGTTMATARRLGAPAGVMLFDPHPREFFRPAEPLFKLTPLPMKLRLLEALGLDLAVVLPFDAALAALPAAGFIETVLAEGLGIRHAVVGYDFNFGAGRTGTPQLMEAEGERLGFGVTVVGAVGEEGPAFSSSRVRSLLREGRVMEAAHVLGHWWQVSGTVTSGAKRGTGLGYPTANFALLPGTELGHGIYAARITFGCMVHEGAAYLGTRPTFDNGAPVLETFLFDFDGDLYGREIAVEFIEKLRGDQAFSSIEALKAQMDDDCARARTILASIRRKDPMAAFPLGRLSRLHGAG